MKVIEVATDLSSPGASAVAIQKVLNGLPPSSKLLSTCANASSVFLFLDSPGSTTAASATPAAPSPPVATPAV